MFLLRRSKRTKMIFRYGKTSVKNTLLARNLNRTIAFNDHNLITAFGNDYGYQRWVAEAISAYYQDGDVVILISSSGKSPNILGAAHRAKELSLPIVTFSGFFPDNPLRQNGDINFWLDSKAYNIIEAIHGIWLTMVVDILVGKCEYSVQH